ncbi:tetratricopeptide repeat protein [Lactobacillus helsingborgensis]|uniref:tetratricopeptide repeat protein n=1 Tax=Lactobacillus helsingborgensis TaxID=1218494 RepID=UPI00164FADFC|nr:tetratricopeptide repeat protein [Lactobacillus helsingborgensis]MBC6356155.1 tetratricopeptide repeat protein [Lactobacillus helsingborgensis]
MTSLSQKNLLNLANKVAANGDFPQAVQYLEEALRDGYSDTIVLNLCQMYIKNGQNYSAYELIKEEKDLFTDAQVFSLYSKVLQANNFLIEALEVKNITGYDLPDKIQPVPLKEQQQIMLNFKGKSKPTKFDYEQLFKLDLINFQNYAQSLLIDPSLNFASRIVLCEDLFRLGIKEKFKVLVLGQTEEFIPQKINLLEKEPIYREVVSGIGSRYYHKPSQLPAVLGEVNLILGSIYPKLSKYVDDPDSFASDIASYIENQDGRSNQKLFERIDHNISE